LFERGRDYNKSLNVLASPLKLSNRLKTDNYEAWACEVNTCVCELGEIDEFRERLMGGPQPQSESAKAIAVGLIRCSGLTVPAGWVQVDYSAGASHQPTIGLADEYFVVYNRFVPGMAVLLQRRFTLQFNLTAHDPRGV
jgi:hypothetical protein